MNAGNCGWETQQIQGNSVLVTSRLVECGEKIGDCCQVVAVQGRGRNNSTVEPQLGRTGNHLHARCWPKHGMCLLEQGHLKSPMH